MTPFALLAQASGSTVPEWLLHLLSVDTARLEGGTQHLRFARFPEGGLGLLALLVIALGCGFIIWNYRKEGSLPAWKKASLASLRVLILAAASVILFYPILEVDRARDLRASTLVLVDESLSQGIRDRYQGDLPRRDAIARTLGMKPEDVAASTRAELVERMLSSEDLGLLDRLAAQNELKVYAFSSGTPRQVVPVEEARPDAPARRKLPPCPPRGTVTDAAAAVRGAVEAEGSGRVAGIVLVTDGRVTAGEGLQSAGAYLREKGIPVHAVGVGDPTPTKNLRVTAILTSERAFTGDSIVADVRIEEEGLDGETARVELLDTFEPEGEPARAPVRIDTQEASFTGGRREAVVSFRFEPEGVGRHRLTARIEPRPEETFTDDNERSAAVVVVKEASKVLLIAGGPSYEYRFLKNLLKRDARIHVAAWLMSADPDYPQEGDTSLKKLPDTTKDLFLYDVVILMDPNPEGFPAGFPDLLEKFVGKHRGGLVLSAGSKFASTFFEAAAAAPIRNMLPVLVNASDVRETLGRGDFFEREWAIEARPAALDHAATRLSSQIDRNRDRWAEIAGIYWSFPARKAKPGATVLFTHPDPALAREGEPRPLIAFQFYEGGRVLWCGIDSVWRWRSTAEEVYDSFWVQSIRYLTEGRLLGDRRRLLQTDSDAYDLGEAVRVSAFLSDENFNPVSSAEEIAVVEEPDGAATELRLDPDPSAPGWFRGSFVPRALGAFRLRLKGPPGAPGPGLPASPGSGQAEKVVSVEPPAVEFDVPRLDEEALRELALLTSGSYSTIAEAGSVPDRILDRRQTIVTTDEPIPLWDNSFSMSLLGLLLTLEWVFRKVNRLL